MSNIQTENPTENQTNLENQGNAKNQASSQQTSLNRRALLKALAVTGGAVAASTVLPNEWVKPMVDVGVLPLHAQTSPTATAVTPTPLYSIITCSASNAGGGGTIGPTDTITTFADISSTTAGVNLSRTITLNQAGHPQNGVVDVATGTTDAAGRFTPPNFDLSTLSPAISAGTNRITILWEFVNASDGTNTCNNNIDVV